MPTEPMDKFMSVNRLTGQKEELDPKTMTPNQLRARAMLESIHGTEQQRAFAQLVYHFTGMAGSGQMSGSCIDMLGLCLATLATSLDYTEEMIDPIVQVYEAAQEIGQSDTKVN